MFWPRKERVYLIFCSLPEVSSISDDGVFLKIGILPEVFQDVKRRVQIIVDKWKADPESSEELREALEKVVLKNED